MTTFKEFWKNQDRIEKKLSERSLNIARNKMVDMWDKDLKDKTIIRRLGETFPKALDEKWKAERLYRTEEERMYGMWYKAKSEPGTEFHIIPLPDACEKCKAITKNGHKRFNKKELKKGGFSIPPIHPNCRCEIREI